MLAGLRCRTIPLIVCLAVACITGVSAATRHVDDYIWARKSLAASAVDLATLKNHVASYVGKTVELKGVINGIARCGESSSFLLDCGGESLLVKTGSNPPECISSGSTIRALVEIGPACVASLSDLRLVTAVYEWEISRREAELAPKPTPSAPAKPETTKSYSPPRSAMASRGTSRVLNLSPAAAQIFEPYRNAIARINPRLNSQQLDTITASILTFSEHYRVDPRLVVALFIVESGFKPTATSPKGAMGLGQLMPGTARGLGVSNPYDPVQNVEASIRLIRGHLNKYGDLALALSAYNAGPGAVRKYSGVPPYRETQNYIRKVGAIYKALCGEK